MTNTATTRRTRIYLDDIVMEQRPRVATVRSLAVRWAITPPTKTREAVAVRSADGALVVVRMSPRGVTIRRNARAADLANVWTR